MKSTSRSELLLLIIQKLEDRSFHKTWKLLQLKKQWYKLQSGYLHCFFYFNNSELNWRIAFFPKKSMKRLTEPAYAVSLW